MRNKLLILIKRKKRIFLVITLLLALLVVGIGMLERYHKKFLFEQMILNEYFKFELSFHLLDKLLNELFPKLLAFSDESNENEYENFYDYLLTICQEIYHFVTFPLFFIKCFIQYYRGIYNTIHIEEIESTFFKNYIIYSVSVWFNPGLVWFYVVAMDINRFRVHKIAEDYNCILVDQKVIKNFNKLIITEKISIDSCEDCLEFIRTFVKLISPRGHLIEQDDDTCEVLCYGYQEPRKIKYRMTPPFIFKPAEDVDYYYVELHIMEPIDDYFPFIKMTFKIKKNGIIYNFNRIVLGPVWGIGQEREEVE